MTEKASEKASRIPTPQEVKLAVRVDELKKEIRKNDGWANVLVGLGGKMDKRNKTQYGIHPILTDEELHNIYLGDGLGTRIVDVVADDMTREWIDLEPEEETDKAAEEKAEELEKVLEDLDVENAFNTALKWKRLYGGALIIIGALDGQTMDRPLNKNRITTIENLKVVDRTDVDIASSEFQTDPSKPGFGQPIRFKVWFHVGSTTIDQMVHVSRCLVLKGKPVALNAAKTLSIEQRFWGVSELQPVYESLRDFGGITDSISNIMYEFIIGKFKMEGLAEMLAGGDEKKVIDRMEIIAMMKSIIHAIMLDENEEYTRDTATLSGIADIMDRYMIRVSGVSGIPVTRLFGRQAGGLNNKGEAEEGIYYDMIRSKQKTELKPALRTLLELVQLWRKNTLLLTIKFNPLFQLSEKEQAEVKKTEAEAEAQKANMYNTYISAGVLMAEDVYNQEWADKLGDRDFLMEEPMLEGALPVLPEGEQGGVGPLTATAPKGQESNLPTSASTKGGKNNGK